MASTLADLVDGTPGRFVPQEMRGQLVELEHLTRYRWACAFAPGRRVLDAGCGVGYGAAMLAEAGAAAVTGVDVEEPVVRAAEADNPTVEFAVADVRAMPFIDGSFDLVVCFEVIEHIDRQGEALDEIGRVLAPDGVALLSSPNRDVYVPGNPHHMHEYTPDELSRELSKRWSTVHLLRQHNFVASTVLGPTQADATALGTLTVDQLVAEETGQETYTLAAAANGPLPAPAGRVMLGSPLDIRAWVDRFASQQRVLEEQAIAIDAAHRSSKDRSVLLGQLQETESRLAEIQATLQAAEDEADELARYAAGLAERLGNAEQAVQDLEGSVSWRLTAPLRQGKRMLKNRQRV